MKMEGKTAAAEMMEPRELHVCYVNPLSTKQSPSAQMHVSFLSNQAKKNKKHLKLLTHILTYDTSHVKFIQITASFYILLFKCDTVAPHLLTSVMIEVFHRCTCTAPALCFYLVLLFCSFRLGVQVILEKPHISQK